MLKHSPHLIRGDTTCSLKLQTLLLQPSFALVHHTTSADTHHTPHVTSTYHPYSTLTIRIQPQSRRKVSNTHKARKFCFEGARLKIEVASSPNKLPLFHPLTLPHRNLIPSSRVPTLTSHLERSPLVHDRPHYQANQLLVHEQPQAPMEEGQARLQQVNTIKPKQESLVRKEEATTSTGCRWIKSPTFAAYYRFQLWQYQ